MNRTAFALILAGLIADHCCPQDTLTPAYQDALRNGALAKVTIRAEDGRGHPVTNATVGVTFDMINKKGNELRGVTDERGCFSAEGLCADYVAIGVEKAGYYRTAFRYGGIRSRDPERLKDGRWLPWNPTIPVVLWEIRSPIPLYVKRFSGTFPNGATVGFDCQKGEFVQPHGTGTVADFLIRIEVGGVAYKRTTKAICLASADPAGGFALLKSHQTSALKSDYLAPVSGYVTNLTAASTNDCRTGEAGTVLYGNDEYLAFRSRITRDAEGTVTSATYGKMYGEIVYGRGDDRMETAYVAFLYYFNLAPNDRNVEFDGTSNLFRPDWRSTLKGSSEP